MKKGIFVFLLSVCVSANSFAVGDYTSKRFNTITSHNDTYPYVLNNTKANTQNTYTKNAAPARRAVVQRPQTARATTQQKTFAVSTQPRRVIQRTNNNARAATGQSTMRNASNSVPRMATSVRTATNARTTTVNVSSNERISSQRCLADYKECMEDYCEREDTAYNRCYCSAKLAQIDSKYQNRIDELIQQIIKLQYGTSTTSDEIKEYWDKTVGTYTNDNPWVNIDNALNIEWADTQSRVRGQNAFNTGHQYCVQHLRGCYYMASNLRDAYKSEIARDCDTYEKSLQKIQSAAESVIESYK